MPIYSYICNDCGIKFERNISFKDNADHQNCPNGHLHVRRVFSPPSIVFKGSGWYSTDNRPKQKSSSND